MTRQQIANYARECKKAYQAGLPKPVRPDERSTAPAPLINQGVTDIQRALTTASIKIDMLSEICDQIGDYFGTFANCKLPSVIHKSF